MVALASYLQSSSGTFLVSVVVAVLSLVITVYPMKWWVLAQRFVLFPFTLISNFVIIYLFASSNSFYFHKMFDFWSNRMGYPDLYERIVQSTTSIGYTVPSFSLRHTILLMAVLSIYLAWTMWSAQGLMGEVKRANDMGRLFKSFLGAGLYLQWIGLFTPILLFQRVVGWDFMNRLAYAYYLPQSVVPFYPTVSLLASMLTTNPVLITLSTLGIVAGGFFIAASEFVIVTRIWLAMSLDRTLPSWFGNVNPRTHTPVGPVILSMVISVVAAYLFDYWPPFYSVITVGSVMGPAAVVFVTSIAAILFPKRRREIYEQAPVARYKPLGIPLIVLIGLASALASFSVDAMYLGAPELGYNAPVPVAFTFGILLLGFLLYYVNYAYQKAKGVDITIAFKQLPPD
jgi:Amino acid permease.